MSDLLYSLILNQVSLAAIAVFFFLMKLFRYIPIGLDGEKSKVVAKSTAENAPDSDRNSKSSAAKLAAKVERFKQSRKSHSETRIVGGVAINTAVNSEMPLSVQSSNVSVKSEPDLEKIQDKVRCYVSFWVFMVSSQSIKVVILELFFVAAITDPYRSEVVRAWYSTFLSVHFFLVIIVSRWIMRRWPFLWCQALLSTFDAQELGCIEEKLQDQMSKPEICFSLRAVFNWMSKVICLCIGLLYYVLWLVKKLTALSQPIGSKPRPSHDFLARVFPRLTPVTCIYFQFRLVYYVVCFCWVCRVFRHSIINHRRP